MTEVPEMLEQIQHKMDVSKSDLANWVGTSLTSIIRWEQSNASPSPAQLERIGQIYLQLISGKLNPEKIEKDHIFASTGVHQTTLPLFIPKINPTLTDNVDQKLFDRITNDYGFTTEGNKSLSSILDRRIQPASTNSSCPKSGMSAGKNTYTYDAHTYHTKMPPQGIAELLKHYLPEGGLVLDPFAGSGMTGVAARALGYDVILNELSPAACFISNQFTSYLDSNVFLDAVNHLLNEVADIRHSLYTTHHRDTGKLVELEYLVWSYSARCHHCGEEFVVWNHCREYGNNVKEHKIRSKFPCPCCHKTVKKSSLIRTQSAPVMVAYRNGNSIRRYPLDDFDYSTLEYASQEELLHKGFYPQLPLYEGINLNQPIRHGIDRIDKFYTARNLLAMNRLWYAINRFENDDIASFLAFVFTSLYQRVTRLSEFRFWGGSGNTARFNVPFIFKEANVFTTFERK
ncbi:MAG: DNA methyltransferase, partial [Aggregatilineales bacterium]